MGGLASEVMARALLQGKSAADIKGAGVKPGVVVMLLKPRAAMEISHELAVPSRVMARM